MLNARARARERERERESDLASHLHLAHRRAFDTHSLELAAQRRHLRRDLMPILFLRPGVLIGHLHCHVVSSAANAATAADAQRD